MDEIVYKLIFSTYKPLINTKEKRYILESSSLNIWMNFKIALNTISTY